MRQSAFVIVVTIGVRHAISTSGTAQNARPAMFGSLKTTREVGQHVCTKEPVMKECFTIRPRTVAITVTKVARPAMRTPGTVQHANTTTLGTGRTTSTENQHAFQAVTQQAVQKECIGMVPPTLVRFVVPAAGPAKTTTGIAPVALKDTIMTGSTLVPSCISTTTQTLHAFQKTKQVATPHLMVPPLETAGEASTGMPQFLSATLVILVVPLVITPTGTAPSARIGGTLTSLSTITMSRRVCFVIGIGVTGIGIRMRSAMTWVM